MLYKFYFCIFFTLVIAVLIPFAGAIVTKILLLILFGAYLTGDILLWQEYKHLKSHLDATSDPLQNMKSVRDRIKSVIKYEQLIGLAFYPISVAAGLLYGMSIGNEGKALMSQTSDWVVLIVSMLVIVPLSHYGAKAMNKKAFGKYLDKLENNIVELEKVES